MYVLEDYRKKGQIWNKFDDSGAKLGRQRNSLTISGHLDVILLIFDKYGRKIANLGQSIKEISENWKWLSETPDLTFSAKKFPLFSPFLSCMWAHFQKQGKNLQ